MNASEHLPQVYVLMSFYFRAFFYHVRKEQTITCSTEPESSMILACSFKSRYEETISFFAFSLVWTVSMLWVWVCITTEFLKIHFLLDSLYYAHRYHWSHSCILQYCWNECLYVTACRSKTDHIQSWAFNLYNQPCKQFTSEPTVSTYVNPHFIPLQMEALVLSFWVTCLTVTWSWKTT